MLRRPDLREERFAELVRLAGRTAPHDLPVGLETRLVAFAEGAASRRQRRGWTLAASAVAAACAAVLLGPALGESPPSAPPAPASARRPAPPRPSPAPPPEAGPLVTALLAAPDWRSRRAAAEALAALGPEPSGDLALARALGDDPHWRVRSAALRALAGRGGEEVERAVARATEDPHLGIRLAAVRATEARLGIGSAGTEALLRRLDRDPDWRVREVALGLLLRSPEGARAALLALGDGHRRLRDRAREALASLR
jgi:HEAT repeat protein